MISVIIKEGEEAVGVAYFHDEGFRHLPTLGDTIKIHDNSSDKFLTGIVTHIHHDAYGYQGKNPVQGDIIIECDKA